MNRSLYIVFVAAIGLSGCATVCPPAPAVAPLLANGRLAEALANGLSLEAAAARSRRLPFDATALKPAVQLIERVASGRLDVQAARHRAAVADLRLESISASGELPRTRTSTRVVFRTNGMNNLVRTGSDIGQAAIGSWPLALDGRDDRIDAAEAEHEAADAAYQRVLIKALHEVADAIAERRLVGLRLAEARAGLAEGEASCEAAYRLYQDGAGPEARWLAASRAVAVRRSLASTLQARYEAADAALLRALGAETAVAS